MTPERWARIFEAVMDEPPEEPAAQRHIGPFEIHGELGHGGGGSVYRAHRRADPTRTPVAVKVMRAGLATGALRDRSCKEQAILAGLDHPGIARLLEARRHRGRLAVAGDGADRRSAAHHMGPAPAPADPRPGATVRPG